MTKKEKAKERQPRIVASKTKAETKSVQEEVISGIGSPANIFPCALEPV